MGYIMISVLLLLIAGLLFFFGSIFFDEDDYGKEEMEEKTKVMKKIVIGVCAGLFVVLTIFNSVYQIPAGHVGVVYRFGAITGQIPEGLQFIAPWKKIVEANTQVQSYPFENLTSFSQETQDVIVNAKLNMRVSAKAIQELYRTVGKNYFEVLVAPRVAQNFKDETVKYKSVDIAPNREPIRKTVRERLEKELSPYSIEVTDLLLENIDFNKGFKDSIEQKQIATQNALKEEQNVTVEKNKADQAIEKAKGAAEAVLINANKQAEANRALSASLTQQLITYTYVTKLSDKVQVMLLPSGTNMILGQDMLKGWSSAEKTPAADKTPAKELAK
jgi:prohibitin 2